MKDSEIIDLYFDRSEDAITETDKKYGAYCYTIAINILDEPEDSKECVNDTYLAVWNSIPPKRPDCFSAFIGRITRNISIDRYVKEHAKKRNRDADLVFDELAELIPDPDSECSSVFSMSVKKAVNGFLSSQSERNRAIFVQRYFYMLPAKRIALELKMHESTVRVALLRQRATLLEYLKKEGIEV